MLRKRVAQRIDGETFERLYAEHAPSLLAFLTLRTGSQPVAEDLLADCFERVLRSRTRFDPARGTAKSWLFAIAVNLVRDHHRRQRVRSEGLRRLSAEAVDGRSADETENVLHRITVGGALAALSSEEQEALSLRYGADLSVPEIAALLREPLTTAEGRVYRGLRKLRSELERQGLRSGIGPPVRNRAEPGEREKR